MDVVEDICSINDLERDPKQLVRKLKETCRPMVVTVDGKPEVIMLSASLFPSKKLALDAVCELAGSKAL